MRKKWVIIRMEIHKREFESKLLIAYMLAKLGYGVVFKHDISRYHSLFPRGLYLINSAYKSMVDQISPLKKVGNSIYFLDEEALVIRSEKEYCRRIFKGNLELFDKVLCVGKHHYNVLRKQTDVEPAKLEVTGNPRLNLLSKKFESIDALEVTKIKERFSDYVLIVSNFGTVNLHGSKTDADSRYNDKLRVFETQGLIKSAEDINDFRNRFDHYETIFQKFISLVETIGSELPEVQLVIRPHPAEDHKIWNLISAKFENVSCVYEGEVKNWIAASSLVIQNGCTSAIESLLLNVPCISYRPIINDDYDQKLPHQVSKNISAKELIVDLINSKRFDIFDGENAAYKRTLADYLSLVEGDESASTIVSLIEQEKIPYIRLSFLRVFSLQLFYFHGEFLLKIKYYLATWLSKVFDNSVLLNFKLSKVLSSRSKSRLKSLDLRSRKTEGMCRRDILETLHKIDLSYGERNEFRVKEVSKLCYIIEI